jgi:hypothetical protein
MSLPKNEISDEELSRLVGQPATRENMKKMKHGGSVGADGTIKSVVTQKEMEQQRKRCPRYYRKRYAVVGILAGVVFLGVLDLIYLIQHPPVLYQPIFPDWVLVNNGLGALVFAIWVVFILDIKRQKDIRGIR